jgi:hypothetical protein
METVASAEDASKSWDNLVMAAYDLKVKVDQGFPAGLWDIVLELFH